MFFFLPPSHLPFLIISSHCPPLPSLLMVVLRRKAALLYHSFIFVPNSFLFQCRSCFPSLVDAKLLRSTIPCFFYFPIIYILSCSPPHQSSPAISYLSAHSLPFSFLFFPPDLILLKWRLPHFVLLCTFFSFHFHRTPLRFLHLLGLFFSHRQFNPYIHSYPFQF